MQECTGLGEREAVLLLENGGEGDLRRSDETRKFLCCREAAIGRACLAWSSDEQEMLMQTDKTRHTQQMAAALALKQRKINSD